jgi:hypothetical protein
MFGRVNSIFLFGILSFTGCYKNSSLQGSNTSHITHVKAVENKSETYKNSPQSFFITNPYMDFDWTKTARDTPSKSPYQATDNDFSISLRENEVIK